MADPLSIAAGVAGLATFASNIFSCLKKYGKSVKNAPKEIEALATEINLLAGALYSLSSLIGTFQNEMPHIRDKLHHVDACKDILSSIHKRLTDFDAKNPTQRLKWPFDSKAMRTLLDNLTRQKQSIHTALSATSAELLLQSLSRQEKLITETRAEFGEVYKIISRVQANSRSQEIMTTFLKCNPQTSYERSLTTRHPKTGLWLTRLPTFQSWLSKPGEKLWFSGIPGAGKTVLAGTIIEASLSRCNEKVAATFFFCDYRDESTQNAVNILSTVAYQIAIQNPEAYKILEAYNAELNPSTSLPRKPSETGLAKIIGEMAKIYDQLFLIIDGLDECGKQTDDVLGIISSICRNSDKTSVALLSRDELNIREKLESEFRNEEISAHTEDITEYVTTEIEHRIQIGRLHIGDISLKDEICQGLVDGAQGMFRWVTCQLDQLADCCSDRQCREALKKLPPTLNETYLRILKRIPQGQKNIIQMALLFIAYTSMRIRQLREALSVTSVGEFLQENSLISEYSIQRLCSSLIRKTTDEQRFEFAHFTVAEFLQNESVLENEFRPFLISKPRCDQLLSIQCLKFLQLKNFDMCPKEPGDIISHLDKIQQEHPFLTSAAVSWPLLARDHWDDERIVELAKQLFHKKKTSMFITWSIILVLEMANTGYWEIDVQLLTRNLTSDDYRHQYPRTGFEETISEKYSRLKYIIRSLTHDTVTPLHLAAMLSLPKICSYLIQQGINARLESKVGSPIRCAVCHFWPFMGTFTSKFFKYIHSLKDHELDTVKVIRSSSLRTSISGSAPSNPKRLLQYALQHVNLTQDFSVVTFLLADHIQLQGEDYRIFLCTMTSLSEDGIKDPKNFELSFQNFLETLNTLIEISDLHWRMCESAWEWAITTNLSFAFDPDIIDSRISYTLEKLISRIIAAVETGNREALQKLIQDPRINVPEITNSKGKTLLHIAMSPSDHHYKMDVTVIELLLKAGCKPTSLDSDKQLPILTLRPSDVEDPDVVDHLVRILVHDGMTTVAQDLHGQNALHRNVHNPILLKALLEHDTEANIQLALGTVDDDGYSPCSRALYELQSESATLLFERGGPKPAMLQSPIRVSLLATRANCETIFHSLRQNGLELDSPKPGDITPLHYLGHRSSLDFIKYLKSIYQDACQLPIECKLPFNVYIEECQENRAFPDTNIITTLVAPLMVDPTSEQAGSIWEQFCKGISRLDPEMLFFFNQYFLDSTVLSLIELGVLRSYEAVNHQCAFLRLLEVFPSEFKHDCRFWPISRGLLCDMIRDISNWADVSTSILVIELLQLAIESEYVDVIKLLLARGVDVHRRWDKLSALEQACRPREDTETSRKIFTLVLEHADAGRLNETNILLGGLGLIHCLTVPDPSWHIEELLKRGADPNMRMSKYPEETALLYHISQGHLKSSMTLLNYGADPMLKNMHGFDAALTAAWSGMITFLFRLRDIETSSMPWEVNWHAATANITARGTIFTGLNGLHLAAVQEHLDCLKFYMENGLLVDPDVVSSELYTPLHCASNYAHVDVVRYLLDKGANVNARSKRGELPLHFAVQFGSMDVVKLLVGSGSENTPDSTGKLPKFWALQAKNQPMVEYFENFVDAKAINPSLSEKGLAIRLEEAILVGDLPKCEELYSLGCSLNIDLQGCLGCSSLLMAIKERNASIVRWLLINDALTQKPECRKHGGLTAINRILEDSDLVEVLPLFLDKYLSDGGSILEETPNPVFTAVEYGNISGLRVILEHMRKNNRHYVDLVNLGEANAIELAINPSDRRHCPPIFKAVKRGDSESVQVLLENGADPNPPGYELSPLHASARLEHEEQATEITKLLLQHGADLESRDNNGLTPLIVAVRTDHCNIVDELIRSGADLTALSFRHSGLLNYASPQMFVKLLGLGLDPYARNRLGHSAIHEIMYDERFQSLVLNGDIKYNKVTPFKAYKIPLLASVLRKLSRKIHCDELRRIGDFEPQGITWSPLCMAATGDMSNALESLLTLGADMEFEGCPEGTALMSACRTGTLYAVKFLVRRGAALSYHGPNGFRTAFDEFKTPKRILHWLLVTRFTDQKKLVYEVGADHQAEPASLRPWSGAAKAELVICGHLERRSDECMEVYWIRLMRAKEDWRGKYVPPQDGRKTARPSRLVPEEPVRVHPDGYNTPKTRDMSE
ncbi:ankyrin [Biscogniauxia sp. FL1348]|nr:ankyrin [Biscogniauxia sp. FL1348]